MREMVWSCEKKTKRRSCEESWWNGTISQKRDRDRPKKTLGEVLKFDMKYMGLNKDMIKDRNTWKSRIHLANPT